MTSSDFVQKPRLLWDLYQQATKLQKTPSEIFRLDQDDELTCWSFDRAVITFGTALENALNEVMKNSKQKDPKLKEMAVRNKLDQWLASGDPVVENAPVPKGKFRDPFA